MHLRLTGLWCHADFMKLWAGQTISLLGSSIRTLALPLTAVLVLNVTPAQMGILTAVEALPSLLLGLLVGAWIDRRHRRPILIATDIGRAALLLIIPIAAILGVLRLEYLYIITFLVSTLGLFFGVAYGPFLVSLAGREHLVEGNSKLEMSRSAAEIIGPGLAGGLVQLVTAPVAIIVDALSFLTSGLLLGLIRTPEPPLRPSEPQQNIWREVIEGLRLVINDQYLRAIAGCIGTLSLFNTVLETILLLYLTHKLGIGPGLLGLIFASGGVGFLMGALLPGRVTRCFGLGPAIIGGILLAALSDLLTPLAGGPVIAVVAILTIAQFLFGLGLTIYNVGQVSLRQTVTPDHLQGRMNATMHVVTMCLVPVGGLLGGALGEIIGLRPTLFVAVTGEILAVAWLLFSPLRSLREPTEAIQTIP
jgi:predicted MFS family arabinose efflux permease